MNNQEAGWLRYGFLGYRCSIQITDKPSPYEVRSRCELARWMHVMNADDRIVSWRIDLELMDGFVEIIGVGISGHNMV